MTAVLGRVVLRFRHWVEREIAFPGRRTRQRLGIRNPSPSVATDG